MNYYTALRFRDRPDLHMTLRYFANVSPVDLQWLINDVNEIMQQPIPGALRIILTGEKMFGAHRNVRVLVPEVPIPFMNWLKTLVNMPDSPLFGGLYFGGWSPHVTCQDASLDLIISGVAIMKKKEVVVEWPVK